MWLKTTSQKMADVSPGLFKPPAGYKMTPAPVSVFFGSEFEDAAKMIVGE